MAKPIYVIGHRNPDTDSICSAIGYAHLKNALGEQAIPARAGKINAETKYVLEYFGASTPVLITDLYPRAKEIMAEDAVTIRPGNTLRELGQLMKQHGLKAVPVTDDQNVLVGMVSVGDLAQRYFDELEMQDLHEGGVDYRKLLRTLDGTLVTGDALNRLIGGRARIAGAQVATMRKIIAANDVVLVGDRENAQLAAIEEGIACLVITGGAEVSTAVKERANELAVIIITTPYDTYTAARLINQSIPVRMVMQSTGVGFKPNDLLAEIKPTIINSKHRYYPVTEAGQLVGLINRDRLMIQSRKKVILVDHNEQTQAVEGIEEAQVVEIIDHHRLGGLETGEPIFIRHDPVGSTATIVANMHWHRGVELPKMIAGLLLSAIISDTLLFKSPTATAKDRETAERLATTAGVNLQGFGLSLLKAGASIADLTPGDIASTDMKEFQIGEYKVAIAQISVLEPTEVLQQQEAVRAAMENIRSRERCDVVLLMVTDIIAEATHLFSVGRQELVSLAFGGVGEDGIWFLPGVMSRKKQIVPPMIEAAKEEQLRG